MTLRKKIFLIVAVTFFGLTVILLMTSYRILLGGIQDIEIQESRKDLDRAVALLKNELISIGTMASEYATWDDMHTFMTSRNPAFISSNFTDSTFVNLKI
ncbi:MAG TPA: CHASE4 domain-containing protein, partial [Syntrophales bacterium]